MNNLIFQAPVCNLKSFDNLFIEMTAKNCNQRCKHCYIDFPLNKNVKDFISVDVIKKALNDTKNENFKCIYLMGAEPMTHPDFNAILRLCLTKSNVCVFTNGSFINEKKARFLKRVQDESTNEIIIKLSIDHFDELKNDEIRGRGSYRTVISAVKCLAKYEFNPIICVTNYYDESCDVLFEEFKKIFNKQGIKIENSNIIINKCYNNKDGELLGEYVWNTLDCEYGRILTSKGIYSCPFLANDYRGRCGSDFSDYSRQNTIETSFCNICIENKENMFGINFKLFEN